MKKTFILSALVMCMSSAAYAGLDASKISVGGGVGYSIPTGNFHDTNKGSPSLAVSGEYKIAKRYALGLEMAYNYDYSMKDSQKTGSITDGKSKIWELAPFVRAMKDFTLRGKNAMAYCLVGMGVYNLKSETDRSGDVSADSQSKFGWNAGAGLMVEVARQWSVGLDLRYHNVNTDTYNTSFITPTARASYRFK